MSNLAEIPIFQPNQTSTTVSFAINHANIRSGIHQKDTQIIRLHHIWSDHSILYVNFMAGQSPTGPGRWRAHRIYASHPALQKQITNKVHRLIITLSLQLNTPEDKWDKIKFVTKKESYINFIKHLYTTRPVQGSDIDNWINFNQTVNQNDKDILMLTITIDELVEQVKCSPKQSSLGNDGLGYGTLASQENKEVMSH
ncbi:hypothetical protein G6F38_002853 [Rhizopus arrhizus]|nr:hypothetical protein G6F38_002853 [Rhizopus arrhizus]